MEMWLYLAFALKTPVFEGGIAGEMHYSCHNYLKKTKKNKKNTYQAAPACIGRRFRYNPTVGQSASFRSSSTQERQPSAPQPLVW